MDAFAHRHDLINAGAALVSLSTILAAYRFIYLETGMHHVSREAFEAERERMRAWHYLRVRMSDMSRPGASVTLEDIHAAEVLLGLQNGGQHG